MCGIYGDGAMDYDLSANKPSVNHVVLQGNKTSADIKVYGEGNEPPYPVRSVNGLIGDVVIPAGAGGDGGTAPRMVGLF